MGQQLQKTGGVWYLPPCQFCRRPFLTELSAGRVGPGYKRRKACQLMPGLMLSRQLSLKLSAGQGITGQGGWDPRSSLPRSPDLPLCLASLSL